MLLTVFLAIVFCASITLLLISAVAFVRDNRFFSSAPKEVRRSLQARDKKLFPAMAKRFPGGRLVFDAAGKRAVKIMLKTWVKDAGVTSIADFFSVDSVEKDILPWMANAVVTYRGYMLGYNDLKDPSVPGAFRLLSKIGDGFMKVRIIRMDFTT